MNIDPGSSCSCSSVHLFIFWARGGWCVPEEEKYKQTLCDYVLIEDTCITQVPRREEYTSS